MVRDNTLGSRAFDFANAVMLLLFSFVMLYPLLYVFSVSVSDLHAIMLGKVKLFPVGFQGQAYRITFLNPDIWRAYLNTILYSVTGTLLVLLINSLTAFPLSYRDLYGRNVLTIFFAITMFFAGGLIPTYLVISGLGMIDTIWAIILPTAVGPWYIIIFRTNFEQIPRSLIEAAEMDGARSWGVYLRIILPLSKPILATIALFAIVGHWNNFFGPLIYLSSNSKMPLQVYLRSLIVTPTFESAHIAGAWLDMLRQGESAHIAGLLEALRMASILVSLGPILLVYPFLQRYFVKGVLVGSFKG